MGDVATILDLANKLTLPVALLLAIYAIVFGKVATQAQVQEVRERATNAETAAQAANARANALPSPGELRRLEASEQRAWDQAHESKEALKQNTATLDRLADAVEHLRDAIELTVGTRARAGGGGMGDD